MTATETLPLAIEADLPEGWSEARIDDCFQSWGGMTPSTSDESYWHGKIPWVSSKDVKEWRIKQPQEFITDKALRETRLQLCPIGSVLVVVRSGILAHTLPITITDQEVTINQDLKAFYSSDRTLNEWLALALRAKSPDILATNRKDGTTVQSVRYGELTTMKIAVPPLPEQKRILNRVEQLRGTVNNARERLARVPAILKRFRQAVLAAACSGRLTADWREMHPQAESVSVPQQKLREHIESDQTELPESWIWATVSQIADIQGGIQKQPKREPRKNSYAYLRVANVLRDRLELSKIHRMELFEGELEKYRLETDDLLIVEGNGSIAEIGRSALWSGEIENCVHQNHIIRVRARRCLPRFLNIYWNSPIGIQRVIDSAVTTAGLFSISTKKVAELWAPVPPIQEQHEIVRRVEALFMLSKTIEKRVASATARAEKLTQGILAKAFRAELVPTEAELARREGRSYESASALLARIGARPHDSYS